MKLTKSAVASAIGLALAGASLSAQANLTTTTVLSFTPAPGGTSGTQPALGSGSWFSILVDPGNNQQIYTPIDSFQGVHIGVLQPASSSHPGAPDGSESPSVDMPHEFFSNTGMHGINGPAVTVASQSGGSATLNFTGWYWDWNGVNDIQLYEPSLGDTGIATLTCSSASCSNTSSYTLDYTGHIEIGGPAGFGGEQYSLHLEGQIASPVPVPAAVWLFGSGLAGVVAMARRRKRLA